MPTTKDPSGEWMLDALRPSRITTEITAKQDIMVNRVTRVEAHIDTLVGDQNNALESNCGKACRSSGIDVWK